MFAVLLSLALDRVMLNEVYKLRNTAAADVAAAVGKASPGTAVTPEPVSNSILLSGSFTRFARARAMIAAMDVAPAQVFISATICEGDPLGSKAAGTLKILSEPKLMVSDKQTGAFRVAGQPDTTGVMFQARVEMTESGKVRLRVTTERVTAQETGDEGQVTLVKTVTTRELRDGETTRLRVGPKAEKETWVELRVDVVRAK